MSKFILVFITQFLFYIFLGKTVCKLLKREFNFIFTLVLGIILSYIIILLLSFFNTVITALFVYIFVLLSLIFYIKGLNVKKELNLLLVNIKTILSNKKNLILLSILILLILFIISMFYRLPLFGHDGKLIYFMKAKIIYNDGLKGLYEPWRLIPHNKYPIFLPLSEFLSLSLAFSSDTVFTSIFFIIVILVFVFLVLWLFNKIKKMWIGIIALIVFFTLPLHFKVDYGFLSRYADFHVSFFLFVLFIVLFEVKNIGLLSLLLAVLPLIKNEGYLFLILMLIILAIYNRKLFIKLFSKQDIILKSISLFILIISAVLKIFRTSPFEEVHNALYFFNISSFAHLPFVLFDTLLAFIRLEYFGLIIPISLILIFKYIKKTNMQQILLLFIFSLFIECVIIVLIGNDFYINSLPVIVRLIYQMIPMFFILPLYYSVKNCSE